MCQKKIEGGRSGQNWRQLAGRWLERTDQRSGAAVRSVSNRSPGDACKWKRKFEMNVGPGNLSGGPALLEHSPSGQTNLGRCDVVRNQFGPISRPNQDRLPYIKCLCKTISPKWHWVIWLQPRRRKNAIRRAAKEVSQARMWALLGSQSHRCSHMIMSSPRMQQISETCSVSMSFLHFWNPFFPRFSRSYMPHICSIFLHLP